MPYVEPIVLSFTAEELEEMISQPFASCHGSFDIHSKSCAGEGTSVDPQGGGERCPGAAVVVDDTGNQTCSRGNPEYTDP